MPIEACPAAQVAWLTPSELFSPHWGAAIARSICAAHPKEEPLRIVEIGAGLGQAFLKRRSCAESASGAAANADAEARPDERAVSLAAADAARVLPEPAEEQSVVSNARLRAGAGSGTQARDILSWLRSQHPGLYKRTSYTSVEISESLAQLQEQRVADEASHSHFR